MYLGNAENARRGEQLQVLGIQCVINCAIEAKIKQFGNISHLFLKWVDAPGLYLLLSVFLTILDFELDHQALEQIYQTIETMRENGGKVLIHCVVSSNAILFNAFRKAKAGLLQGPFIT